MLVEGLLSGKNLIASWISSKCPNRGTVPTSSHHKVESNNLQKRNVGTDEGTGKYADSGREYDEAKDARSVRDRTDDLKHSIR